MTLRFKEKIVRNLRHGLPTDTRAYRYVSEKSFTSVDGQSLYVVQVYKQYDRDDIIECMEHENGDPVSVLTFWY